MQDRSPRVHRRSTFNYNDSVYLDAAEEAKFRSLGHCQKCGRLLQLEAHHWSKTYPPADLTTPDDLTAFCRDCHDEAHDFRFFLDAGGSPDDYRAAHSELVATLLRPPTMAGRWAGSCGSRRTGARLSPAGRGAASARRSGSFCARSARGGSPS